VPKVRDGRLVEAVRRVSHTQPATSYSFGMNLSAERGELPLVQLAVFHRAKMALELGASLAADAGVLLAHPVDVVTAPPT
jgi:hypothetical protein